jgi:alkylation response protein AidB-like acyl-CoA dehydrogenase
MLEATDTLATRTAALVPVLKERAAAAEKNRRVADDTYDLLSQAGIFKMTAPKVHGGYEADFHTQAEILADVARGCPSTSWVATIYSAMSWLVGVFPDKAQDEIFAGGDPRIAGVFSPTGTATPKDGGFVINGRWGYNTGCHGARWTIVNALQESGLPTCVIVESAALERLDDWYASGMSATGSNTVVAKNIFVPAHRTMPLPDMLDARYPARHNADNPYFNLPLAAVLTVNAGGTPIGIARGAMETFRERLPGRAITYTNYTNKAEAPVTHLQIAEASMLIDSAEAHLRLATDLLDRPTSDLRSMPTRVKSRAHIAYATGLARNAVDILFYASGAASIQEHVPIQRYQRDIQALANHAIMHPQTGLELYGRILCGLQPNTLLY